MSDNPFAEPGDADRTVIRPMPGGAARAGLPRRAAPPPADPGGFVPPGARPAPPRAGATVQAAAPVASGPDIESVVAGSGPLAIAAAPLLHLLARLRNAAAPPDPGDMRERTRRELRGFERRAREAGVPQDQLRLAHYALCAALDDVVLNTPWGAIGRWAQEPLARALHHDEQAGRGFFEQIRTLRDDLPQSRPVLEIMFLCLCLGMMGPYRAQPDGAAQLDRVRHHVHGLITAPLGPAPATLSERVAGVDAQQPPRRGGIPVWVALSAALAAIAGLYAWQLSALNARSDAVYAAALAAPPDHMPSLLRPPFTPPPPPPPPPARPGPAERLGLALAHAERVEVVGSPASVTLRVPAAALFPSGNATLRAPALIEQLAAALRAEPGAIRVLAFTDDRPTRQVGFPSAFALTTAWARAVQGALGKALGTPERVEAEGRADAEPLAPNRDPAARERNRHVDIVLTPPA